jgi:MFS family permease
VTRLPQDTRHTGRRALGVASGTHALHDGYTDLIYVMLPLWQAEFGLGYAAVGLIRGAFAGTMASFQIPSGLAAERYGAPLVLAAGTALAGLGYCLAGASLGFATLLAALLLAGLGASTQHPIASALVARAFAGARSMQALGGYNFAGDVGKMTVPALVALMLVVLPWRATLVIVGAFGLAAALAVYTLAPRYRSDAAPSQATPAPAMPGRHTATRRRSWFPVLTTIGILDSATRMGFLTFLPFVLEAKGASFPAIGLALTLVFAGGAVGKLACAFIGARIGAVATVCLTEVLTALAVLALLPLSLAPAMIVLPVLGIALNGTSSVLYGSVPDLVPAEKRTRAFGIFYTATIGAGALAPVLYGFVGDAFGVTAAVVTLGLIVLFAVPLVLMLRPALAAAAAS